MTVPNTNGTGIWVYRFHTFNGTGVSVYRLHCVSNAVCILLHVITLTNHMLIAYMHLDRLQFRADIQKREKETEISKSGWRVQVSCYLKPLKLKSFFLSMLLLSRWLEIGENSLICIFLLTDILHFSQSGVEGIAAKFRLKRFTVWKALTLQYVCFDLHFSKNLDFS